MSGDVSIKTVLEPFEIIAEHLVLIFFLFFLLQLPQTPSIRGTPTELPQPKIINFVHMDYYNHIKIKIVDIIISA